MRKLRNFSADRCYHLVSRVANKAFYFTEDERGRFVERMWRIDYFSCVEVLAYCVMSNHFHILVYVPHPRELSDEEVLSHENNRIARDILVILTKGPNRPAELRKELGVNSANYFTSRYLTPMLEAGFIEREKGRDAIGF